MAKKSLKQISEIMGAMDLCMLTTVSGKGITASRPMSNNGDVKYSGRSYFFSSKNTKTVKDLRKNSHVNLAYSGSKHLQKLFISVSGKAKLITDRTQMDKHWNKDLEIWFADGLDTPGLVMIEVTAKHIKYWHGHDEGEHNF